MTLPRSLLLAVCTLSLLGAGATVPVASQTPTARPTTTQGATVVRWSDGDTVVTDIGTVRLIGIDTPERGRCGALRATSIAKRLAPAGTRVQLVDPGSVKNQDRYGRLLRYVVRRGVDVGRRQIVRGAVARYDSRDGYQRHPRQASYRRTDAQHRNACPGGNGSGGGSGAYAPISQNSCPGNARIKGNRGEDEWIYHLPSSATYDATNPEECFATESAAQAAGYRRARD